MTWVAVLSMKRSGDLVEVLTYGLADAALTRKPLGDLDTVKTTRMRIRLSLRLIATETFAKRIKSMNKVFFIWSPQSF